VLLENLVGAPPTLPVDVLLHNRPVDDSLEQVLERARQAGEELTAD